MFTLEVRADDVPESAIPELQPLIDRILEICGDCDARSTGGMYPAGTWEQERDAILKSIAIVDEQERDNLLHF